MANPFWPNSEHKLQSPSLEDLIKSHIEHKVESAEAFAKLGKNLQDFAEAFQDYARGSSSELYTIPTGYEDTFRSQGYLFNSLHISDATSTDGAKLVVSMDGISYTLTLSAGFNEVNIPDGATYKGTTTSGNPFRALLTRYNKNR